MPARHSQNRPFRGVSGAIAAIGILVLCAIVANWLEPAPTPLTGSVRASDGDSFHYGEERVRLLGIDAPELKQTCTDATGSVWPCGQQAREKLAELLRTKLSCVRDGRDRYGRVLARCEVEGGDLGATLVATGWAVAVDDYWTEEDKARRQKLGIWAGNFISPKQWRDSHGIADEVPVPRSWFERLLRRRW